MSPEARKRRALDKQERRRQAYLEEQERKRIRKNERRQQQERLAQLLQEEEDRLCREEEERLLREEEERLRHGAAASVPDRIMDDEGGHRKRPFVADFAETIDQPPSSLATAVSRITAKAPRIARRMQRQNEEVVFGMPILFEDKNVWDSDVSLLCSESMDDGTVYSLH